MNEAEGDVMVSAGEIITVWSSDHELHSGQIELLHQELVPSFEDPSRFSMVRQALTDHRLLSPNHHLKAGIDLTLAHDIEYIQGLASICAQLAFNGDRILPSNWGRGGPMARADHPATVRLGDWSRDTYTSVGSGTFKAAAGSARSVTSAMDALLARGHGSAFALSRPPHHHAGRNYMGGYCYMNGPALAAMKCRQAGLRAAVIDVDYHHGNGTQDILYQTNIPYCSIHGDPRSNFPYFAGFADEVGEGEGEGFNLNIPMADGTDWDAYRKALSHVATWIGSHRIDVAIISLGVDTFKGDPVGKFEFSSEDFSRLGQFIRQLGVPTLFVMEGGYAVREIGDNVANVLTGFLQ